VEWIAKIDGTFTVRELKKQLNTGTRVVLKFNDEGKRYAKRGVIEEVVTRYGSRLGEQIVIKKKPYEQWVGEDHGWDFKLKTESDIEEFRDACWRLQYDRDFLDVFSLHHSRHKIRGFALIDGERVSTREHRRHKVYSNGMFVTDEPGELIPKWASFARIEVELNSIRLTASRESIYTDEQYGKVKKAISKMLLKQLLKLAESNPALLRELIEQNDGAFREIAFEDNEFFDAIIRHLPFETNQGSMKLEDYLKEHDVIRVAPIVEQFRMIGPIAGASGQVIFNGGYTRHAELLERAGARLKGVACEMIDARSYVENLGDADEDLVQSFDDLLPILSDDVEGVRCRSVLKSFVPGSMPAVYLEGRDETLARSLDSARSITDGAWSEVVDALRKQVGDDQIGRILCLNAKNPTIMSMMHVDDPELVRSVWGMCYVRALLDAQQPLTENDSRLFARSMDSLFRRSLSGGEQS